MTGGGVKVGVCAAKPGLVCRIPDRMDCPLWVFAILIPDSECDPSLDF